MLIEAVRKAPKCSRIQPRKHTHFNLLQQPLRFSRELLRSRSHASTSRTAVRSSAYGTAGRTSAHTAESSSDRCASLESCFVLDLTPQHRARLSAPRPTALRGEHPHTLLSRAAADALLSRSASFWISRLNIAHGCPLLGLTALRGEHPHTLPSRAGTAAPSQRLASLATEPAMGRPPKARACGARDCSEWNPAGRGRRSLWRRRLERCRYGCPDPAGSSDAATAVPIPQSRAIQLRLSRFCARERCRYRRPAQRFGQNYSRIGHFNSNCSD